MDKKVSKASSKEVVNPIAPEKREKIHYNKGLGWCEKTQTWFAHVRIGKQSPIINTEESNFRNAETWLYNFKKELGQVNKSGANPNLTLEDGLALWATGAPDEFENQKGPNPHRIGKVLASFNRWILPHVGKKLVRKITREELNELIKKWLEGASRNGPHAKTGLRNFLIDLNTVFHWLLKAEKVTSIPRMPVIPQRVQSNPEIVPFDKVWQLIDEFDQRVGYDIYAMTYIRVLSFCGVRTDNARNLCKEQFNAELTVFNTGLTKNGETYNLPIPDEVKEFLVYLPDLDKPGFILHSGTGKKRSYRWCMTAFKEAADAVGISPKMAWHALRRTCATMLIRHGADPFLLMQAMGWKTIDVARHYISTDPKEIALVQRKAINGLKRGDGIRR